MGVKFLQASVSFLFPPRCPVAVGVGGGLPRWTQRGRAGLCLPPRTCVWVLPVESRFRRVIFLPRGMQATGKGHLRLSVPSANPRPLCAHTFVEIRTLGTCASCERQRAHTVLTHGGAPGFCSDGHRCREARACGQQLSMSERNGHLSSRRQVSNAPRRRGSRSADVFWGGPGGLGHDASARLS